MQPGLKCQNLQNLNPPFTNVKTTAKMAPDAYKEEEILIAKILSAYSVKKKTKFQQIRARLWGVSQKTFPCVEWPTLSLNTRTYESPIISRSRKSTFYVA
jgi:hypothetical protein